MTTYQSFPRYRCAITLLWLLTSPLATSRAAEWKSLFNGRDLSHWDKFMATPAGSEPLVANHDPKGVFTVTNLDGEAVIHVSGESYGGLTTQEDFENFHFRVDFRWGLHRWAGREHVGRDSGVLYCGIGQPNPRTGWLTSIENNVMEKGVGQWWSVNGAIIDVEGAWITPEMELLIPYKKEGSGEKNIVYKKGGPRLTPAPANGITPAFDLEKVFDEWSTIEVVFWGGHCLHILNGKVNLVLVNPRYPEGNAWRPFRHGKIQLQSEGAEVFYRKAEVRPLDELPAEFLSEAISPAADEQGFAPLLTEPALAGWKQCGPGSFDVKEGVASGKGGMGLWWYSSKPFKNFILRGEFRQSGQIADSGVFMRFPDPGNDPWVAVKRGHEMEIGDPNPEKPTWRTGSIYPFKASTKANTRPFGEWNEYEITAIGHDYSVRINGDLVTAWSDRERRSLEGFIGLQNYNDGMTVSHRNLRVKELP